MTFASVKELVNLSSDKPLWQVVLSSDAYLRGVPEEEPYQKMLKIWHAMKKTVECYQSKERSASGLVGGMGGAVEQTAFPLCDNFMQDIISTALKTGECNACMKCIVAAPTAGASGVLPAVLLPLQKKEGFNDEKMITALFVAGGFGQIIASKASISGAEGGCQAEIGSASGMAAAAIVSLMGGTAYQMEQACSMALSNMLGLVCDPVGGLVEVPCVWRNVAGATNALTSAQMALSNISFPIPCDEVIEAMRSVGDALPSSLRETGKGGLAATVTGKKIATEVLS